MPSPRLLLAAALSLLPGIADAQRTGVRRLTIIEQNVIRIPLRSTAVPLPRPVGEYRETRGPKCIARSSIAGASLNGPKSIDFVLRDQTRYRDRLLRRLLPQADRGREHMLGPGRAARSLRRRVRDRHFPQAGASGQRPQTLTSGGFAAAYSH